MVSNDIFMLEPKLLQITNSFIIDNFLKYFEDACLDIMKIREQHSACNEFVKHASILFMWMLHGWSYIFK